MELVNPRLCSISLPSHFEAVFTLCSQFPYLGLTTLAWNELGVGITPPGWAGPINGFTHKPVPRRTFVLFGR
jgi:hypothetical protein